MSITVSQITCNWAGLYSPSVKGKRRRTVNSPHKWPAMRKWRCPGERRIRTLLNVCGLSPVSKCNSVMQSLIFTCECQPEMESQFISSYPDTDIIHIQIHIPFISRYKTSHLMCSKRWKSHNWFSVVYCKSQFNARWNLIHVLIFHVVLTASVHTFYIHLDTLLLIYFDWDCGMENKLHPIVSCGMQLFIEWS